MVAQRSIARGSQFCRYPLKIGAVRHPDSSATVIGEKATPRFDPTVLQKNAGKVFVTNPVSGKRIAVSPTFASSATASDGGPNGPAHEGRPRLGASWANRAWLGGRRYTTPVAANLPRCAPFWRVFSNERRNRMPVFLMERLLNDGRRESDTPGSDIVPGNKAIVKTASATDQEDFVHDDKDRARRNRERVLSESISGIVTTNIHAGKGCSGKNGGLCARWPRPAVRKRSNFGLTAETRPLFTVCKRPRKWDNLGRRRTPNGSRGGGLAHGVKDAP